MASVETAKENLLRQMEVLEKSVTAGAVRDEGIEIVLKIADTVIRTAEAYASICRLDEERTIHIEPIPNYIPSSSVRSKLETAE